MAVRNATREKENIRRMRSKWPGVFLNGHRGPCEVVMRWDKRDVSLGGTRRIGSDGKPLPEPGKGGGGRGEKKKKKRRVN